MLELRDACCASYYVEKGTTNFLGEIDRRIGEKMALLLPRFFLSDILLGCHQGRGPGDGSLSLRAPDAHDKQQMVYSLDRQILFLMSPTCK